MDIFFSISSNYNAFTKAEKKIAQYILNNSKKVLHMSITDLAEECKVGDTSVFRFCKTLKLKGYQDFKVALAQSIPLSDGELPQLEGEVVAQDTIGEVAKKIMTSNINALEQTYRLIEKQTVSDAVNLLINANRIIFFGIGASNATAIEAHDKFIRITPNAERASDSHIQLMKASLMSERDVAVVFSYSGSNKDIIEIAKEVKSTGAKAICITRFIKSPLTDYSDLTLLCGGNEGPLEAGSLSVKIAQLYLIDVLYTEYFKRTLENSIKNKEKTSKVVLDKLF